MYLLKNMLLINPATEQFGGMLSRYVPVGVPIAMGTLASYLMKFGYKVKVVDEELGPLDENNIEGYVQGLEKPYVFGVSILTAQAHRAYDIIRMLKKKYSDCIIIVGGIHVTALPEEGIRKGADIAVRGEGEVTLHQLYKAIREGRDWSNVDGITFSDKHGNMHHNRDAKLIQDIDEVPLFPYELFEHPRYDKGFIVSSRGCPYTCTYCSQRLMTGLTYRYKSPKRMVEELSILVNRYGQKHISFYDDNFAFKRQRVIDLCDAIIKSGLHKKCAFSVQTRADNFYEAILPHMKQANFTGVCFGMETGVDRLVKVINKGETIATHKKAIDLARKWGIKVSLLMIFGLPTETHEDRMYSFKLMDQWNISYTKFNNLIPYPGTALYRQVKGTSQMHVEPEWANMNSTLTATRSIFNTEPLPYTPEGTTPWELKRDIMRCNFGFYFKPKNMLKILRREDGPGFVLLPKYWYLNINEIWEMTKLALALGTNLLIALLPSRFGAWIYRLVTGAQTAGREKGTAQDLPKAIDGTMREVIIDKKKLRMNGVSPAGAKVLLD